MHTVVIGAGPAGLSAGYELVNRGEQLTIYEQDKWVGGISRTVSYHGYRFDIGGHRFFSKNEEIEKYWKDLLGDDLLTCHRLSRIYYGGKFYDYPLKVANAFRNLGLLDTTTSIGSYVKSRLFPRNPTVSFEDWVINHFGFQLYQRFFKTYTEKVWGMPCHEISADWAVQRIQGLSLSRAIWSAIWPKSLQASLPTKSLIEAFRYPRLGPGMLWERVAERTRSGGGTIHLGAEVRRLDWTRGRGITGVKTLDGRTEHPDQVISSMPLRTLIQSLVPRVPEAIGQAAESLQYRDFITVALIVDAPTLFPDQWIYIHDPRVKVGRIQNFKNWSPDMVANPAMTCLGMEYFCFAGDGLWAMSDQALLALAEREARLTGLLGQAACVDGMVVRVPKAYPVYDDQYVTHVLSIRHFLEREIPNLQCVGRNGMHRYNNQDHAMLTGMLAAQNVCGAKHDLWAVNADAEYLEDNLGVRRVPRPVATVKDKGSSY